MAIGLQIRNPDLSQKLTPRYSDFMRGWAKKDPCFCQYVHDKLTELVKLAKEVREQYVILLDKLLLISLFTFRNDLQSFLS